MTSEPHSLTVKVVEAVAEREGVAPIELDEPLHNVIDAEAIDRLFKQTSGKVVFDYCGYEIAVVHDGQVEIQVQDQP